MCECRKIIAEELNKAYPESVSIGLPYEEESGRSVSVCHIHIAGKMKVVCLLHSYCPRCGEKYEIDV